MPNLDYTAQFFIYRLVVMIIGSA